MKLTRTWDSRNLSPKSKAKDSRSHKANVQRQYLKVKSDHDHKSYVFNDWTNLILQAVMKHNTRHCEEYVKSWRYHFTEYMSHLLNFEYVNTEQFEWYFSMSTWQSQWLTKFVWHFHTMRWTINPHLEKELAVPELSVKCIFQDLELGESAHGGQTNFFYHHDTTHTFTFIITDDDLIKVFCRPSAYI